MACEQYFTECKRCGKRILMTKNQVNNSWIPCDPEILRFRPTIHGSSVYVTEEGIQVKGERDRDGTFGYKGHRRGCWYGRKVRDSEQG